MVPAQFLVPGSWTSEGTSGLNWSNIRPKDKKKEDKQQPIRRTRHSALTYSRFTAGTHRNFDPLRNRDKQMPQPGLMCEGTAQTSGRGGEHGATPAPMLSCVAECDQVKPAMKAWTIPSGHRIRTMHFWIPVRICPVPDYPKSVYRLSNVCLGATRIEPLNHFFDPLAFTTVKNWCPTM